PDVPAEVREAGSGSAARSVQGTRAGVRCRDRGGGDRALKRFMLIAAVVVAVLAGTATTARASSGLNVTEAKGPAFPVRTYVVSLPTGRKLTIHAVSVTENGKSVVEPTFVPASEATKETFGTV